MLGAILGDGGCCERIRLEGERRNSGSRPQFLAQLEVTLELGQTVTVYTTKNRRSSV